MAKGNRGGKRTSTTAQDKTLNDVATKIKNLKKEQLFVVNSKGEIVFQRKSQDKGEVQFTRGEAREFFNGNVVIHNHPSVDGVAGTFSAEDLSNFGYGAKQIQVSSIDGRYIMKNKNYGTKKQYDGWFEMQQELNKRKSSFPTDLEAKDIAKKQPKIKNQQKKVTDISKKWLKAKETGNQKEMDKLTKQYAKENEKYKKALKTETRKQTVNPYHEFYKQNASKYGFQYVVEK